MHQLIEAVAAELERPREITSQVVKHVDDSYGVDRESIGQFLHDHLPSLEDYEHDLILSPLFTPKLADQAVFAELLSNKSVPRNDWPTLIHELAGRPTRAHLITSDRKTHLVTLREVSIERFVNRLRLDGAIAESLLAPIAQTPPADHPLLKAVARRAGWDNEARRNILLRYLTRSLADGSYSLSDAVALLKLVEDYQPADSPALLARIPRWEQTLREEIQTAHDPKPFFSGTIQAMHGGNDQRQRDEERANAKRNELAFLKRLQLLLSD